MCQLTLCGTCRAFSAKEATEARLPLEHLRKADREGYFYRIGDRRFEDGYLFKSYNVRNLSLEEGVPPLEELQRFNQVTFCEPTTTALAYPAPLYATYAPEVQILRCLLTTCMAVTETQAECAVCCLIAGGRTVAIIESGACLQVGVAARAADTDNEGGELAQLMEALGEDERAAGGTKFGRDDKVIVMEGELKTLVGRVVEVKGDGFVRIMPILEGLEELDLPARHLQKFFQARP